MEAAISLWKEVFGNQILFSLAIDATKVPQLLEMSQRYKSIIGGEYPHHMINIESKTKAEIKVLLEGIGRKS